MNSITIRKARLEDVESIAALGLCVWIDTYATQGLRFRLGNYALGLFARDKIQALLRARTVLVAEQAEHLVAYAVLAIDNESTEVENLYVLPKFQRRGIGRTLINTIACEYSGVWLACWEQNDRAIGFYKALGFIEHGESFFDLDGEQYRNVTLVLGT